MIESTDEKYPNLLESNNHTANAAIEGETKPREEDEGQTYNTMALLELATCVETHREPIEFPSTEAVLYPKSGMMVCLLCLEDVETNLLSDHMVNAHNYRTVRMKCSVCGMKFAERSLLMIHKNGCKPPEKRHKRKSFQQIMKELDNGDYDNDTNVTACPMCSLSIPRYCLKDHMISEHLAPELSLTCETCKRTFKTKLSLREHIKLVHNSVEETEECDVCGQKFRSQKYLNNHRRNVHPTAHRYWNREASHRRRVQSAPPSAEDDVVETWALAAGRRRARLARDRCTTEGRHGRRAPRAPLARAARLAGAAP